MNSRTYLGREFRRGAMAQTVADVPRDRVAAKGGGSVWREGFVRDRHQPSTRNGRSSEYQRISGAADSQFTWARRSAAGMVMRERSLMAIRATDGAGRSADSRVVPAGLLWRGRLGSTPNR